MYVYASNCKSPSLKATLKFKKLVVGNVIIRYAIEALFNSLHDLQILRLPAPPPNIDTLQMHQVGSEHCHCAYKIVCLNY